MLRLLLEILCTYLFLKSIHSNLDISDRYGTKRLSPLQKLEKYIIKMLIYSFPALSVIVLNYYWEWKLICLVLFILYQKRQTGKCLIIKTALYFHFILFIIKCTGYFNLYPTPTLETGWNQTSCCSLLPALFESLLFPGCCIIGLVSQDREDIVWKKQNKFLGETANYYFSLYSFWINMFLQCPPKPIGID